MINRIIGYGPSVGMAIALSLDRQMMWAMVYYR